MSEPIQILLIENRPDMAAALRESFSKGGSPRPKVECAASLEEGIPKLDAAAFDAFLLDLSLPGGVSLIGTLRQRKSSAALIVLAPGDNEELVLSGVRAGADEFLLETELAGPSLVRRVRSAIERCRAREATRTHNRHNVLGFLGVRGGAGTTTVALNVAAVLARQGKNTVAVEMKPDLGLFSFQLKHAPAANLRSLASLAPEAIDSNEVSKALCTFPHGLRVLFGPQKPEEFGPVDPRTAAAVIRTVAGMAECTVVDLSSVAFPMTQAVVRECHYVSMVLERDAMSGHAAKLLLPVLHSWGISEQITGAIVVGRTLSYVPTNIQDIAAHLTCPVVGVVPPAVELCAKAAQAGSPIAFLDPNCTYSTTLTELALRLDADTVRPMER